MDKLIIPLILVMILFVITFLFVKWLNQRVKPATASSLIFKFGVLWDDKKKPYCKSCLKKLEPHLSSYLDQIYPVYEIECIHCQTVHSISNNGVKADYYKIVKDV